MSILLRDFSFFGTVNSDMSVRRTARHLLAAFQAAVARMDKSLSPQDTLQKLRQYEFTLSDTVYIFHIINATFWLTVMETPAFPYKLLIPVLYTIALVIPFTSQFFVPATPVFAWLLTYYSARFVPDVLRPPISVVTLPTLESVLYGANISDILTRFTHPILDILAWLPYGVIHFTLPFFVAAFLWLFRPKQALHLFARAFGYLNVAGVLIQIAFPCAPPWYEVIHGLTPAHYKMLGSPGGLGRIDAIFGGSGYTNAFSHSPVIFGAFPSLHSGCATIDALFLCHFFPQTTKFVCAYVLILYWSTMYLTHHYLVDVVGGACLAAATFYYFLPDDLQGVNATAPPGGLLGNCYGGRRSKYDIYDLDEPRRGQGRKGNGVANYEVSDFSGESEEEEVDITYRSPVVADGTGRNSPGGETFSKHQKQPRKSHKHTASIASLIRADDRVEDGWSPIGSAFTFPPTPNRGE